MAKRSIYVPWDKVFLRVEISQFAVVIYSRRFLIEIEEMLCNGPLIPIGVEIHLPIDTARGAFLTRGET